MSVFEDEIIIGWNGISQIRFDILNNNQIDKIWHLLTDEYIALLDPLWTYWAQTSGKEIGGNQGHVTNTQIEDSATEDDGRFYPSLSFAPNPQIYTELVPFPVPLLSGSTLQDNGADVIDPATEYQLIRENQWNVRANAAGSLTALMNSQNSLDLSEYPPIETARDVANAIWAVDLVTIAAMIFPPQFPDPEDPPYVGQDDTAAFILLRDARINAMAAINPNIVTEVTTLGEILYNWIGVRISKASGVLTSQDLYDQAIAMFEGNIALSTFKLNSLT